MSTLRVVVVYPDLLGTYGDGGNGEILAIRSRWRGHDAELLWASSSEPLPRADIYCLGGGEDGPQVLAARRLADDGTLAHAVGDGAVVLAVCAGFQVVGASFPDAGGVLHDGLGLLDVTTTKGAGPRAVGEVVATVVGHDAGGLGLPPLSGFENHAGVTALGPRVAPLAHVTTGVGNGSTDGSEGAWADRVVGTYLHGPVLARNPSLADLLLAWALGVDALSPIDDAGPQELRRERVTFATKASGLARRAR